MRTKGVVFEGQKYFSPDGVAEPPSTVLADVSRYKNDGTFKGAGEPDWVRLPSGLWVMQFDGSNDYVLAASKVTVQAFTALLWFKLLGESSGDYNSLISNMNGSSNNRLMLDKPGTALYAQLRTVGPNDYERQLTLTSSNNWHLYGQVWTGSNFYIFNDTTWSAAVPTVNALISSSNALKIGATTAGSYFTNGQIALPRLFNYALTAGQILQIFEKERSYFGV